MVSNMHVFVRVTVPSDVSVLHVGAPVPRCTLLAL